MRIGLLIASMAILGACVTPQTTTARDPLVVKSSGQQNDVAVCSYRALEPDYAAGLRLVELRSENTTQIYSEQGSGHEVRPFDVIFVQESPEMVRIEIRGFPTVYGNQHYEKKVLSLIQPCLHTRL